MKDTSKLLSIGSVVLLKGGTKRVMVIGYYTMAQNDQSKMFDYSGCMYPEGVISSDQTLLFNHDQIEKVVFNGFKDEEEVTFKQKLGQLVNKE